MTVAIEQVIARTLRAAWANRRVVKVRLAERCAVPLIVGKVSSVSVTGVTATVDGWEITIADVLEIGKPLIQDTETYAQVMHDLRAETSCSFCEGRPVRNAAGWIAAEQPEFVPCPRCGREAMT